MNANELADGILAIEERIFLTKKEHQLFQNSATMLRQQQAEIEALKKQNDDYWTMIEILRQRLRGNPLQDRFDEIAAGVVFGKAQEK